MCDYSLGGIDSRLAKKGEDLVVRRFSTGSIGLASPRYPKGRESKSFLKAIFSGAKDYEPKECAVCIQDGAKLQIQDVPPSLRNVHNLSSGEVVTLRQLTGKAMTYRDAFQFRNGESVLLQVIPEGLCVKVL